MIILETSLWQSILKVCQVAPGLVAFLIVWVFLLSVLGWKLLKAWNKANRWGDD